MAQAITNFIHSHYVAARESLSSANTTSTFLTTGKLTPDEFVKAGDFLVHKFPTWSWSGGSPSRREPSLPADKQFLFTKGVPCHRRLDDNFAGLQTDKVVEDAEDADGEGWLSTGGTESKDVGKGKSTAKDVKTVDEGGKVEEDNGGDEDSIPDMEDIEDDDPEAIIPDRSAANTKTPLRTYTLYICYTKYWSTPRIYLAGQHGATNQPLSYDEMMEDVVGDYKEKTVTIEEFPHLDGGVKMPSVHPCKHASVMRLLLDRANAAAKAKRRREKEAEEGGSGLTAEEREWEEINYHKTLEEAEEEQRGSDNAGKVDEAAVVEEDAIGVDQYLVVFLKFIASVTPGIEHDFTMAL